MTRILSFLGQCRFERDKQRKSYRRRQVRPGISRGASTPVRLHHTTCCTRTGEGSSQGRLCEQHQIQLAEAAHRDASLGSRVNSPRCSGYYMEYTNSPSTVKLTCSLSRAQNF
jgi:hypothetical protein